MKIDRNLLVCGVGMIISFSFSSTFAGDFLTASLSVGSAWFLTIKTDGQLMCSVPNLRSPLMRSGLKIYFDFLTQKLANECLEKCFYSNLKSRFGISGTGFHCLFSSATSSSTASASSFAPFRCFVHSISLLRFVVDFTIRRILRIKITKFYDPPHSYTT